MKKKLDTRFPASRIKKIMQADEDVGKIAMAVPVLVSKALELFLQDLCDRTYDITLRRGAKTVNSLHLKHCVQSYNVFDFLREVVSKVPDYGHSDAGLDDRTMIKRKKAAAGEMNESDEELKRNRMEPASKGSRDTNVRGHLLAHSKAEARDKIRTEQNEARQTSSNGRGRGRGRPRGRGRGRGSAEREPPQIEVEPESRTSLLQQSSKQGGLNLQGETDNNLDSNKSMKGESAVVDGSTRGGRDFDLNAGLDENTEKASDPVDGGATSALQPPTPPPPQPVPVCSSSAEPAELKQEDYLGLSLSEMDRMAIDTHNLAQINSRLQDEDEDYDEE